MVSTCTCIEQGRTITAHHRHFIASTCTVHVAGASPRQNIVLFLVVMVDFALGSKGLGGVGGPYSYLMGSRSFRHKLTYRMLTTALCLQSMLHFFLGMI